MNNSISTLVKAVSEKKLTFSFPLQPLHSTSGVSLTETGTKNSLLFFDSISQKHLSLKKII